MQRVFGDAGVVDENIDLAELADGGFYGGFHAVFVGHIHAKGSGLHAFGFGFLHHGGKFFFIARCQRDVGACLGQSQRTCAANSL